MVADDAAGAAAFAAVAFSAGRRVAPVRIALAGRVRTRPRDVGRTGTDIVQTGRTWTEVADIGHESRSRCVSNKAERARTDDRGPCPVKPHGRTSAPIPQFQPSALQE